nr:histidine phosphatase family protein [Paracoccus sp. C2R09]
MIRHGETTWNRAGRLQGAMDAPLTARGVAQAHKLAVLVRSLPGRRFCSPQGRAQATADIAFGPGFTTDERLREIGIGAFAGLLLTDLRRDHPHLFTNDLSWYDRCPDGEGFEALARRCRSFLGDLDGPAVILTHGITLRMLRLLVLGLPMDRISDGDAGQGRVHLLRGGREYLLE